MRNGDYADFLRANIKTICIDPRPPKSNDLGTFLKPFSDLYFNIDSDYNGLIDLKEVGAFFSYVDGDKNGTLVWQEI